MLISDLPNPSTDLSHPAYLFSYNCTKNNITHLCEIKQGCYNRDMPKIVDHAKQREKIVEATWRVILREGIGQTSVRKVAEEAGLSPGAMRHYFSTQSELLAFSMAFVSERFEQRVRGIKYKKASPLEYLRKIIEELLPLDQEKMQETAIWFAFASQATPDPRQQELSRKIYADLRSIFVSVIDELVRYDLARTDLQREVEIDRFYALVDGLAVHKFLQPDQLPVERMRSIVSHHLASLCRE